MDRIRLLVVDDHPALRDGIGAMLRLEEDMECVAEASSGEEAISLFRTQRPDVTLMDLQMPGMGGIEAIRTIRKEFSNARIIVLTTYQGDVQALRALKAGACGYLLKSTLRKMLIEAIRAAHAGKRRIDPDIASELAEHVTDDALNQREIEVLKSAADGNSNKIIASRLNLSEATVKGYMTSILAKLGANDRTHAATIAIKRGYLID